jgi:hypothetical protein
MKSLFGEDMITLFILFGSRSPEGKKSLKVKNLNPFLLWRFSKFVFIKLKYIEL